MGAPRNWPEERFWRQGGKKLDALAAAAVLEDLRIPPGNRLEALKGDRKGEHSIRINDQYRICFRWTPNGPEDVQVVDYHGGFLWFVFRLDLSGGVERGSHLRP